MKRQALRFVIPVALAAVMSACGGYNQNNTTPPPTTTPSSSSSQSVINIGDSPSDSILSLEFTINSIVVTDTAGKQTSVLPAPARVEVTHLAGTFSPLAHVQLPNGSYTGAVVTISNPEIHFINSAGQRV